MQDTPQEGVPRRWTSAKESLGVKAAADRSHELGVGGGEVGGKGAAQ